MSEIPLFAVPQPDIEPTRVSTVKVQFRDGSSIRARDVIEVFDDGEWLVIKQGNGDFITLPVENNIQYVEVSYDS